MATLHILSSPYSPVNINNRVDPFSIAVLKFIKYMTDYGWRCIHYGIQNSHVDCENYNCNPNVVEGKEPNVKVYNQNAGSKIAHLKSPGDIIVCFHGIENKAACDMNPELKVVEPSIGYMTEAVFAPYRAFVSYAQMHMFYGARGMLYTPGWFDAVIPNAMTPEEFEYNENKKDYVLYFGRVIETKGVTLAIQATEAAGKRLVIAGPGSIKHLGYTNTPKHVEIVGVCNAEQRKNLMRDAQAIIGPTYYIEPFGNMVTEGYMSGTPAITTDWGGFAETVVQGVTGYRCREFREFVAALDKVAELKPKDCLDHAMKNYSDEVVHRQFNDYFSKVKDNNFYRP